MNAKVILVIAVIVSGFIAYSVLKDEDSPESSVILVQPDSMNVQQPEQSAITEAVEGSSAAVPNQPSPELVEQIAAAGETEQELQVLMQEYNQVLDDPVARAELKKKMDVLLAQYNEQILPVALDAMRADEGE